MRLGYTPASPYSGNMLPPMPASLLSLPPPTTGTIRTATPPMSTPEPPYQYTKQEGESSFPSLYVDKKWIGGMKCPNQDFINEAKTYNRYNVSLLLKVLPEAIKQDNQLDGYFAVAELSMMRRISCRGALLRMYNSLVLLSSSYLGMENYQLCLNIMNECKRMLDSQDEVLPQCYEIVESLRKTPKNHMIPLLWNSYCNPTGTIVARNTGIDVINNISLASLVGWRTVEAERAIIQFRDLGLNQQELQLSVAFHIYLHEYSRDVLGLLGLILQSMNETPRTKRAPKEERYPMVNSIFRSLGNMLPNETLNLFYYWWQKLKHPYPLILCVVAALSERSEVPMEMPSPSNGANEERHTMFKPIKFQSYENDEVKPLTWPKYSRSTWWGEEFTVQLENIAGGTPPSRP